MVDTHAPARLVPRSDRISRAYFIMNNSFYKTKQWYDCRIAYLKSRGYLCEECLKKGLIVPATQVHHKIHLTDENVSEPEIALNHSNLEALCYEHHNERHERWGSKKRYYFDEKGDIVLK